MERGDFLPPVPAGDGGCNWAQCGLGLSTWMKCRLWSRLHAGGAGWAPALAQVPVGPGVVESAAALQSWHGGMDAGDQGDGCGLHIFLGGQDGVAIKGASRVVTTPMC